jgi:NAD(P)-dependent dehydrogenase (short-subunit alcohol dehydrogenase family)
MMGCPTLTVDRRGTTVLVTGATSGIGRETALGLGRLGADVLVHGRDRERGSRLVADLQDRGSDAMFIPADFSDLDSVRKLAAAVREGVGTLDVLVNNAGTHFRSGQVSEAGIELTFVVNHLAPFLLTKELRSSIPDGGRVVTVASRVHRRATMDFDGIRSLEDYDGFAAYARSKLANILFTRELARREPDIDANCLHPGFVPGSGLWRDAGLPIRAVMMCLDRLPGTITRFASASVTAAETPVYLAASEAVADTSGEYFVACEPRSPSETARDDELARRLWEESEAMIE